MVSEKSLRAEWKDAVLGGFLPLRAATHSIEKRLESERNGCM